MSRILTRVPLVYEVRLPEVVAWRQLYLRRCPVYRKLSFRLGFDAIFTIFNFFALWWTRVPGQR